LNFCVEILCRRGAGVRLFKPARGQIIPILRSLACKLGGLTATTSARQPKSCVAMQAKTRVPLARRLLTHAGSVKMFYDARQLSQPTGVAI